MKTKVLISGSYGTGNVGDEVILQRILSLFEEQDVTVLSQGESYTRNYFPNIEVLEQTPSWKPIRILKDILKFRLSKLRARIHFLKALKKTDVFIVGGGGLFAELVPQVLEFYLHQIKWASFLKTKVVVMGVGVGPLRTEAGKANLGSTFNKCVSGILVRDQQSLDNLRSVGVENGLVCPDFAFLGDFICSDELVSESPKKVVLNLYSVFSDASIWENAKYRHDKFVSVINETIGYLIDQGFLVELLPFGTKGDLNFCKKLAENFDQRVSVFEGQDFHSIQERFKGAFFSITMRFHAGLLSFLHGVPSLCIDQQYKSERLLIDMGREELLLSLPDGFHKAGNDDLEFSTIKDSIEKVIARRSEINEATRSYFLEQKSMANDILHTFLDTYIKIRTGDESSL